MRTSALGPERFRRQARRGRGGRSAGDGRRHGGRAQGSSGREPGIVDRNEATALATVFGKPLDQLATGITADQTRVLCGALLESPQFLLQGIAGRGGERPKLTPTTAGYDAVCTDVASHVAGVACTAGKLTLAAH